MTKGSTKVFDATVLFDRDEFAAALKVSTVTIASWLSDEFEGGLPCKQRGGHGKAYEFDLDECIGWWQRRESAR